MKALGGVVRNYAWGSRTALAELLGGPVPSSLPEAELWIGAHPAGPSAFLDGTGRTLAEVIDGGPVEQLGTRLIGEFGPRLPFLLKIIAAARPLSIQVHPGATDAERGFAREEAAGVPLGDRVRSYQDRHAKPELLYALSEFRVLCGFRAPAASVDLLDGLADGLLAPCRTALRRHPGEHGVRAALQHLLNQSPSNVRGAVDELARARQQAEPGGPVARACALVAELAQYHPDDPGVLVALLMNELVLQPGQALFAPAGVVHSYISGVGVEIMRCSDNVLRCSLTSKHVDVDGVLQIADLTPGAPQLVDGVVVGAETTLPVSEPAFRLSRIDVDGSVSLPSRHGPQILLNLGGPLEVATGLDTRVCVGRGAAVWVRSGASELRLTGAGPVFRATDGLTPQQGDPKCRPSRDGPTADPTSRLSYVILAEGISSA